MATPLEKNIKKRGVIKGSLTRFKTFLNKCDENTPTTEIQQRLNKLESLWTQFDEVQLEIEMLDTSDDAEEASSEEREAFESEYFRLQSHAEQIISTRVEHEVVRETPVPTAREASIDKQRIKLPALSLPEFDGDRKRWLGFKNTFAALVDSDNAINNVTKFRYLLSCLKNGTEKCLEAIEINEQNYKIAWDILENRYANLNIIKREHMRTLFEYPAIQRESHQVLRKFHDDMSQQLRALEALGDPVPEWARPMIYLFTTKLDNKTRREWEEKVASKPDEPSISEFMAFVSTRCQMLETMDSTIKKAYDSRSQSHSHVATHPECTFCKSPHYIYTCQSFLELSVSSRWEEVKKLKLCSNCLRADHTPKFCKSRQNCRKCSRRHNTLLHYNHAASQGTHTQQSNENKNTSAKAAQVQTATKDEAEAASNNVTHTTVSTHSSSNVPAEVLLSTARLLILDKTGKPHRVRILLDSGSQSNFVTRELSNKLQLDTHRINMPVVGISQAVSNISHSTKAVIKSLHTSFKAETTFLILDKITGNLPVNYIDTTNIQIPGNIALADPEYHVPDKIDLLIGASLFFELMLPNQIKLNKGLPILQNTKLGWVLSGNVPSNSYFSNTLVCNFTANCKTLQNQLERFWRQEECVVPVSQYTKEELRCEEHFVKTVKRDETGRFIVKLPLRDDSIELGDSYSIALKRFQILENKLLKNPELRQQYNSFMHEYGILGHMSEIEPSMTKGKPVYYLPHHGISKDSSTTRLRVVFDASCKTADGSSLNDKLMVGPTIQDDLFAILLRFRKHNYVLAADIEKMYRQIWLDLSHRDLQRILWRASPEQPIKHFTLNTVTYGTASAAFLAIRSLHQIGLDYKDSFPIASQAILKDFYVDDVLTGSDTVECLQQLKDDLVHILNSAGFPLRKFSSNACEILTESSDKIKQVNHFITDDKITKTLGLVWNSESDKLMYMTPKQVGNNSRVTKRIILSTTSKIFDPLGLAGPFSVKAKMLLQKLWQLKIGWDDDVPNDIKTVWLKMYTNLNHISSVSVPRHVLCRHPVNIELHCFCDASEQAYGTCLYLRSTDSLNNCTVRLLCAKSRVAPLKKITLPKLELCGALLSAQLAHKVIQAMDISIHNSFFWCDSTIVLSWISSEPCLWKTFVSNRVTEIQNLSTHEQWHYVNTGDNPADIISRGSDLDKLINSKLWWQGPHWLSSCHTTWPKADFKFLQDTTERRKNNTSSLQVTNPDNSIFLRYSSLHKLQRIIAWILRFKNNVRSPPELRVLGPLTVSELNQSLDSLIKVVQFNSFFLEIQALKKAKPISNKSKLLSLNPFFDDDDKLRVGGRLKHSSLDYYHKFPLLLPSNHPLTDLIIWNEHCRYMHAGVQATLAAIRQRYWIINGKNSVKRIIRKCVKCFRVNPQVVVQQMGELPEHRIKPSRPFSIVGIDFAGPFYIKDGKYRNRKLVKCYLTVFVCFTTKAVHLELTGDLTTDSFLNTLKRFTARRGLCNQIYSDNGSNFVGAKRELDQIRVLLNQTNTDSDINTFIAKHNISWKFIPPRAPHFGGLWEAAVKSAKYHLKRILGNAHLTFESLYTVVTQVEAVLNSRPLTPLSPDPNDLSYLTPGHFLVGDALASLPEREVNHLPSNRLNHYQQLQRMVEHFWARWSAEYLTSLQQRSKWKSVQQSNLVVGSMVILKEDNVPPIAWKTGRIVELFPAKDGQIRVVSVKTASGIVKRATTKICVLPFES